MELLLRGERAVLASGEDGAEADPHRVALGGDLAEDLHEWARVTAAVLRTGNDEGAEVVSQRGRQLAARVAEAMGQSVRYRDPVTKQALVVPPARHRARHRFALPALGQRPGLDPSPPWATGLIVAGFVGVVVVVAMLALASTLAAATNGWVALAGAVVLTAGLAPSLWLGRRVPIVRWVVLGTAAGVALSWLGVLFIAFG